MSNFRNRANEIINETEIGGNTRFRVGNILKDLGSNRDTFNTLTDLRAYSDMQEGDIVFVKAHNATGLHGGYGGGEFIWKTTPLFTAQSSLSAGLGSLSVTPITVSLSGDGSPSRTDEFYGDNLVFDTGIKATVVSFQQALANNKRSHGIGETSVRINMYGNVSVGDKAYFDDDDGVYIRPTFAGFNNEGYWERILPPEGYVTVDMYGAIPQKSFRDANPYDSTDGIQKAFDSLFHTIVPTGHYYISNTIYHRRPKAIVHAGTDNLAMFDTDAKGRYEKVIESKVAGQIYTDQNIDLIDVRSFIHYRGYLNCELIPNHNKRAMRLNARDRVRGTIDLVVQGNQDSVDADLTTGTRAIEIDQADPQTDRLAFSSTGYVSGVDIKLLAHNCYSGHTVTTRHVDLDTFVNGITVDFKMDRVKKPIEWLSGCDLSRISGTYQSRSGLLSVAEQAEIAIVQIQQSNGGYIDVFGWDMVGVGRHNILVDIVSGNASIKAGPRLAQSNMWGYVTARARERFDLSSRLVIGNHAGRVDIDQLESTLKVVRTTFTSAQILDSFNTPLTVLPSSNNFRGADIVRAYIQPLANGTTRYTAGVTMQLRQNTGGTGSTIRATFDVNEVREITSRPLRLAITEYQGMMDNSVSQSLGQDISIRAVDSNPVGGDVDWEVTVFYHEVPNV